MNQDPISDFEREVLHRCIATVKDDSWRNLLELQLQQARVKNRTEKTFGYYIDFEVPAALRIPEMTQGSNRSPMLVSAGHPDGRNAIDFILYVRDGVISFMEASSTSDWPDDESSIRFLR